METVFPCRSPEEVLKRDQAQSDGISLPAAGAPLQGVPDQECPVKTTFKVEFPDDWKLAVPPVFNDKHHLNNNSAASLSDNEPENTAFPAAAVFFSGTTQYEDDCSTTAIEEKKVAPTTVKAASLYSNKTISEVKSPSSSKRRRILDHCEVEADGLQFLNSYSIALAMDTDEKSVEFCQKLGLLPMKTCCPLCGDILNQVYTVKRKYKRTASRFQCNRRSCKQSGKNTVSVKDKSWFQNSSLSYRKNLIIMKCYVEGMETFITIRESSIPEENSKGEVGTAITSSESVIDLYAACREVCAMSMLEFSAETVIGGQGKTVELGESCFERFKNRSEVQNHWMLAGICRETDKVFLDKVPFGNPEAVLDVLRRHVKSGSHIITQCSPVIQCMSQCFQDGYTYSTGISEGLQQTPSRKNTETKHWVSVRKHFPFARITGGMFALHLAELLWRRKHRQDRDPLRSFIEDAVSGIVYVQLQSGTAALNTVVFSCFISFRCTMSSQSLRPKVIQLYKTLLHLGRDYPKGYDYFRAKLKNAFMKNKDVTDPEEIQMLLARGDYIIKELEALYMLRKYRTLKKRYYSENPKS